MAKAIDGIFALLLLIGALLHGYGTITGYEPGTEVFVWSLSGTLAAALIAVLNLLRRERRGDRALALICLVACLIWAALALGFGAAIGNVLDPRVLWHAIAALALAAFSLKSLTERRFFA
jgi:membrane protein DedA with SNARE-associated domain